MTKTNHFRNVFYLSLTALIWGVAFVFQSMGNDHMGAFSFTSVRYLLGSLVLVPFVLLKARHPRFLADSDEIPVKQVPVKLTVLGGIFCGLVLGCATVLQQLGMKTTTVGKAGFITALYIILTPIFGLFLGSLRAICWCCSARSHLPSTLWSSTILHRAPTACCSRVCSSLSLPLRQASRR